MSSPPNFQQHDNGGTEARRVRIVSFACVLGLVGTLIGYWPEIRAIFPSKENKPAASTPAVKETRPELSGR